MKKYFDIYTFYQKRLRLLVLSVLLVIIFISINPFSTVFAAEITVTTTNIELDGSQGNGECSLQEALANANEDNSDQTDCTGGSGDDIISLPAGTYMISTDIIVDDNLTIIGSKASTTIIDRGASNPDTTQRVFYINSGLTVNLNNITIQNGHAEAINDDNGGGIYNNTATLNINNSIITDNSCGTSTQDSGYGAGIYNNNGTLNINTSIISNNTAKVRGGGIANENGGVIVVNNSTLSGNQAQFGGGIANYSSFPQSFVNNSTFTNNTASIRGGGIHVEAGGFTTTNSTFSANTGNYGAGINNRGQLDIFNSTIAYNETSTNTSGSIDQNSTGTLNIYNSIVAFEQNSNALNCAGTINDGGYNLEDANDCGFGGTSIFNTDPSLNPLADNGGPTLTHALLSSSPAIDRIPSTNCTTSLINGIDQRGAARNFSENNSSTDVCDIGAYESRLLYQMCNLISGTEITVDNVIFNFSYLGDDLTCVTVEQMGPDVNHLLSSDPDTGIAIQTNNWWHISGNGTEFTVSITLPYNGANADSRVCKWPGDLGGYGWDCGDGSNTTNSTGISVTRSNINSFSDWAVGDNVGPTSVTLSSLKAKPVLKIPLTIFGLLAILAGGLFVFRNLNHQNE